MKAADLRKAILQSAVQGKLVPQNKNDEPASELLKRIQTEKVALIKEGKLKKEKPLLPIAEDEIPYDLPDGWVWCRLGSAIYDVFTGPFGSMLHKFDYIEHGIPLINPMNIVDDQIVPSPRMQVGEDTYKRLESYVLKKGDIVIARRGELGRCAVVGDTEDGWLCGTGSFYLKLPDSIFARYFTLLFRSNQTVQQLSNNSIGSTMNNLNHSILGAVLVSIPPFEEQQRIVSKVDELMTMCDELEAAEKELDTLEEHFFDYLPKSILQAAVQGKLAPQDKNDEPASELLKRIQAEKVALIKDGKLKKEKPLPSITEDEITYDLPKGWAWCRLGDLCQYGVTENAEPSTIPEGSWILELEDIEKDAGRILKKRISPQYNPDSTKHVFKCGDILYSKLRPYLNKVLIADSDGYCTSEILPLHFPVWMNKSYVVAYFRSPLFVDYANRCSYGVKMPRLGTRDGQLALFPLPPLAEQQRIVAKVDELMAMCDELKHVADQPIDNSKIILFPVAKAAAEPIAMAARGDAENLSAQAKQAIEDLFGEDV